MKTIHIESIDDPQIAEFLTLKDSALKRENQLLAETHKVVSKLIERGEKVTKVFCTLNYFNSHRELLKDVELVLTADKSLMEGIVGFNLHHGVMAISTRPEDFKIEEIGEKVIVLNGLTSPENVGKIVRSATAFGVKHMIVDYKTCSPYLRRAIRVSMGNIFDLYVHHTTNLVGILKKLSISHKVFLTANIEGATTIRECDFTGSVAVVIGSEGHGIEPAILEVEEFTPTKIEIDPFVMHLNASVAASIYLYEISNESRF